MSKKDYILLARALKDSKPVQPQEYTDSYHVQLVRWNITVEFITFELVKDNPRFNRNKFLNAAGYNE